MRLNSVVLWYCRKRHTQEPDRKNPVGLFVWIHLVVQDGRFVGRAQTAPFRACGILTQKCGILHWQG